MLAGFQKTTHLSSPFEATLEYLVVEAHPIALRGAGLIGLDAGAAAGTVLVSATRANRPGVAAARPRR